MFRQAPNGSLYQGDILVVPEVALRDRDPNIATREPRKTVCGQCNKKVADKRQCEHCSAQLPTPDKNYLRLSGLSSRQARGEQVLGGDANVIAGFSPVLVMIESHSCDIDRQDDIAVWIVRPLGSRSQAQQASIRSGEVSNVLYLGEPVHLPECFVDFNAAFTVPSWALGKKQTFASTLRGGETENALIPFEEVVTGRVVSLTPAGLKRLYEAKVRHLTRQEYELDPPLIEPDDLDRPVPKALPKRGWDLPPPKWTRKA